MKIVFVNRFYAPDHSATSQMLTDLAVALAADGNEVRVVTSRLLYDDPAASLAPHETVDGVGVHRIWTSRFGRGSMVGRGFDYLTFYVSALVQLSALVQSGDVVVAKTDPPLISVVAGWVARRRGARLVNWLQDLFPEVAATLGVVSARGWTTKWLGQVRDRSLKRAAANVVLGRLMRERVAALGVDPRRIAVIPNWADGARLRPLARDANPLRAEWGLDDRFVVGYSGNLGRVHELRTLLDAMHELVAQKDIVFLFIGGGAQKAELERVAIERKLTNIAFRPYQPREQLALSLAVPDVHVVTLRPELEGLVVPSKFAGVAAVGRPTIFVGDPDGEIGSIVRETESGIPVKAGDVGALTGAIVALRDDPRLRERMGANARRALGERYDMTIAIGKWQRLLRDVTGAPAA